MNDEPGEIKELLEIADRLRRYAFAHPLNPLDALKNPKEMDQYTYDFVLDGYWLRVIFSIVCLSSCKVAQLSLSDQPDVRPIPPALVDRVRDAFFDPVDVLDSLTARERNGFARLIGQPEIANDNTEQFMCRNPRMP